LIPRHAQPAHLRRARIDKYPHSNWGCQDADSSAATDLLKDGIRDAVVDHQLLLPSSLP